jgi:hypothetical protein
MEIAEFAERLEETAAAIPPGARDILIRLLELPEEALAGEIGRLHEQGFAPSPVDLLIDVFDEPVLRSMLLTELRCAAVRQE